MSEKGRAKKRIHVGDFRFGMDEKKAISEVVEGGRVSEWQKVKEFERLFARYAGAKHCVAISSGTSALIAGLLALKYDKRFPKAKNGAKIITSPVTYAATVNAVILTGFEPVFVDIDQRTFKLNTQQIEDILKKDNPNDYAGILPVHLMGYPNDMDEINAIAGKYGLFVFEDAAQAHGTMYGGKRVGSLGLLAAFSFYIAHNIQAGEMGCITTDDEKLRALITQLKANGRICDCRVCTRAKGVCPGAKNYDCGDEDYDPRFTHEYVAYNFKTTEFTASLGVSQVKKADEIFMKRQQNVKYLNEKLAVFKKLFHLPPFDANVSYLAYPVIIKEKAGVKRKDLRSRLDREGVENRPLFGCMPLHQPAFSFMKEKYEGKLPVADYIGRNAFYIGCHQYLDRHDLDYIAEAFKTALGNCARVK